MSRRYLLSRPRTKMYDYNYTMGERYYRPTLDSLDQRGGRGSTQTSTASAASAAADSLFSAPAPRRRSLDESSDVGDDVSATIRRIRASRAAMEEETRALEETQVSRRAANRARLDVSDRLMDSVGLKTNTQDEFTVRRPRRAISEIEDDPFFKKRTLGDEEGVSVSRWTKMESKSSRMNGSSGENGFDEAAASKRAKQSRARIAEIESEMEDLAQKAQARRERRAAAEAALNEAADLDTSSAVSSSVRVKRTMVTEKRSVM